MLNNITWRDVYENAIEYSLEGRKINTKGFNPLRTRFRKARAVNQSLKFAHESPQAHFQSLI